MNFVLKIFAVILVSLFFSLPALAQTSFFSPSFDDMNYSSQDDKDGKDKKKRDEFKVFGALSFNNLNVQSENYETTTGIGWMLGGSYKRGKFFYWELGARYNRAVFDLANAGDTTGYLDRLFGVSNIDVPITFGINTLWFVSRIVNVRVFVSAVPEFVLGVRENDLDITKDDLNTFNFCAQGGVGVDILFIYLEGGIHYGFNDLLKDHSPTNPIQGFVSLGFRF